MHHNLDSPAMYVSIAPLLLIVLIARTCVLQVIITYHPFSIILTSLRSRLTELLDSSSVNSRYVASTVINSWTPHCSCPATSRVSVLGHSEVVTRSILSVPISDGAIS